MSRICYEEVFLEFCCLRVEEAQNIWKMFLVLYEDNEFVISVDPVMNFPQTEKLMCYI